jgi:hypothetical protein
VLRVREVNESHSEAERWRLVRDFATQLKPLAVGQLQLEDKHFADLRFAQAVDVAAAFR